MRKISVLLENPSKSENIGTVIRNIYAFDAGRLFLNKDAPLVTKIGSACGTGEKVSIQKLESIPEFLKTTNLRKIGFIVAQHDSKFVPIDITKKDKDGNTFEFKPRDLLIFGTERSGLTEETKAACDVLVTIPMLGHMACLNLATTTGIALYEVLRQKIVKGSIIMKKIKRPEKKDVFEKAKEFSDAK